MTVDPMMPARKPLVERAFEIARAGEYDRIRDIARHLRQEGYLEIDAHLSDCPRLRLQLRNCLRGAVRAPDPAPDLASARSELLVDV